MHTGIGTMICVYLTKFFNRRKENIKVDPQIVFRKMQFTGGTFRKENLGKQFNKILNTLYSTFCRSY